MSPQEQSYGHSVVDSVAFQTHHGTVHQIQHASGRWVWSSRLSDDGKWHRVNDYSQLANAIDSVLGHLKVSAR